MSEHGHVPTVGEVQELDLTADAVEESQYLQRHFGRREILLFTICTLVGVDSIGAIASGGAEAFSWLVVLALVFFIPQALLFAELGTAFPEQGGPYLWARLAFGRLVGAVNNFLYWITNPVWFGGTLAVLSITTYETIFNNGNPLPAWGFYLFGVVFIWIGTLSAIFSFSVGKWIPIAGAWARFALLGLFTFSVIVFGIKNGLQGVSGGDFGVSYSGFVLVVGLIMFSFVGFELPNTAGDEMKDAKKDVPYSILRSTVASILLYGVPVLGILVVLPTDQVTGLGGFIDAIKSVFTLYGGSIASDGTATLTGFGALLGGICAILFILCTLSSGTTWIMGSDRALAVSGYDGAGPRYFGKISPKFGTPIRVNVMSGILSTIVLILVHQISGGQAEKYFTAILGIAVSTTLISYIGVFPALWMLRHKYPNHPRPFRAPWAPFLSIWLTLLVVYASIQLVAPGLGDHWFGSDFRPDGWVRDERVKYFITEAVPLLIFVALGLLFYALGAPVRRDRGNIALIAAGEVEGSRDMPPGSASAPTIESTQTPPPA
jgi:glutamate:GABA antiporter